MYFGQYECVLKYWVSEFSFSMFLLTEKLQRASNSSLKYEKYFRI